MALELLELCRYRLVLATKRRDPLVAQLRRDGYTITGDLGEVQWDSELKAPVQQKLVYWPSFPESMGAAERLKKQEAMMRRADGQPIPVLFNGNLVRLGGQRYSLNSLQDISQRKQAEAALRASEQQFSNAFEYAAVGVALLSPDGCWLRVNQALCDMLGYRRDELLGGNFQDITHPEDIDRNLAAVERVLSGEIDSYQQEKRYIHKSGRVVWASLRGLGSAGKWKGAWSGANRLGRGSSGA